MILPDQKDAIHKAWLYRVLINFCDSPLLSSSLYFKGGTCAAMRGLLDRFSVDLDFDYVAEDDRLSDVRLEMERIFDELGMEIKDRSKMVPQYFLRYKNNRENERNSLKIDVTLPPPRSNRYEPVRLVDIDRILYCQTADTMFSNKMVALVERHEKNGSIAGRDLYDLHHFFITGQDYNRDVILERRNIERVGDYLRLLLEFITNHFTERIISQDLNMLLPYKKFRSIRKTLINETIFLLRDEIKRIS